LFVCLFLDICEPVHSSVVVRVRDSVNGLFVLKCEPSVCDLEVQLAPLKDFFSLGTLFHTGIYDFMNISLVLVTYFFHGNGIDALGSNLDRTALIVRYVHLNLFKSADLLWVVKTALKLFQNYLACVRSLLNLISLT